MAHGYEAFATEQMRTPNVIIGQLGQQRFEFSFCMLQQRWHQKLKKCYAECYVHGFMCRVQKERQMFRFYQGVIKSSITYALP